MANGETAASSARTSTEERKQSSSQQTQDAKKSQNGYSLHSTNYSQPATRGIPHSVEAEQGVLGSILIAPDDVLNESLTRLTPEYFHIPSHRSLYETLVRLWDEKKPIDLITLTDELAVEGKLDEIGGAAFVTDMFTYVPSAANAGFYIDILREKHILRQIINTCTECSSRAYDQADKVDSLLDEVEQQVLSIAEDRYKDSVFKMEEEVMKAIDTIEQLYKNRGSLTGLPSGFKGLDNLTSGLHGSEMFVIAARPSMGKTALAMNIAEHVAVNEEKPVAVFSLEMSTQQLVQRLLCSIARVNLKSARDGFLSQHDFPKLTTAASRLSQSKFFIDDTAGLTILELRAKARRLKAQHDIQLIVIDYLQLLRSNTRRAQDNRQLEIAEISSGIKALAKELNIPILVLAQLNRQPEQRTGGKPRLSDLRESGSIEQDADVVGLLVRKEYYDTDDEDGVSESAGEAELIIAKQRNGPTDDVKLTFLKEFTRFEDRAREQPE